MRLTYATALSIIGKTGLSPEDASRYFLVSGMTIRRWKERHPNLRVPALYVPAFEKACRKLVSEGKLDPSDPELAEVLTSEIVSLPCTHCAGAIRPAPQSNLKSKPRNC